MPGRCDYVGRAMHHRSVSLVRARRPLLIIAAVLVVVGGVFPTVWKYASFSHHSTVLATGTTGGVPWKLVLSNPNGQFCMGMSGGSDGEFGASCGFGPASSLYDAATGSQFPAHANLIFGPAPSHATQVRISPATAEAGCAASAGEPVITRTLTQKLPSWAPSGKWFLVPEPLPLCAWRVSFFDATGKAVLDHTFS
jgi:hypothetical protein